MEEIVELPPPPFQLLTGEVVVGSEFHSMLGGIDGPPQASLDGRLILNPQLIHRLWR
jgi:hypothetical protein